YEISVPLIGLEYSPPKISWRGNGQQFAINFYENGQRFVKVFDDQLRPLNVSSEYPNLMAPIAFMVTGQCIACTAIDDGNTIVVFEKNCKVKNTFAVPENKLLCVVVDVMMHVMLVDLENFTSLAIVENPNTENCLSFHGIDWSQGETIQINLEGLDSEILKIQKCNDLTLQLNTIKIDTTTSDADSETNGTVLIYAVKKLVSVGDSEIELNFSLDCNRELNLNGQGICNDVTSFITFQNYLLVTTLGCKLYCIRILEDGLACNELDLEKVYSREIEQGARIVTVSESNPPQIIMVLPRGNLETIRCRLLTIDIIEKLLSEKSWKTALSIMRLERINWNLLVDLNPQRFFCQVQDFVEAAEFCANLSTIVNDFTDKRLFYQKYLPRIPKKYIDKKEIVRRIVQYLTSVNLVGNLSSIVLIQEKHFSLKSALDYIKIAFELNSPSNDKVCKRAVELLVNKRHYKDVLEAAYALYSLDFLTFLYRNSSEDPRIYEQEIAAYRTLTPAELRFKMSLKANNPKSAVKYLVRCDNYDDGFVETFIVKHQLEDVAYKCLPDFSKRFDLVSLLYAKRLSLKGKRSEAAFVLRRANLVSQALEEYIEALDWREVLNILESQKFNVNQYKKVLYDLSYKLSGAHRVDEAVLLLDKYCKDYKEAVRVLVEAKAFKKAICLAKEHNATDVLEDLVMPALKLHMLDLRDKIDEFGKVFDKYFSRLQQLREEKRMRLTNPTYEPSADDLYYEMSSLVSFASSRATSRTRSSQLSSKNRRKEARKKLDLREGGYYEDIALIRALHILYGNVFSLGRDVREVCLIFDHRDLQLAKSLHVNLSRLQNKMKSSISLIWPDEFINVPQVVDDALLSIIGNRADLDPEYCVPPKDTLFERWELDIFL
ncbi:hypothetical protein NQ315_015551, partial [Exocentrus adspersus]